jgi:hypothetical protein
MPPAFLAGRPYMVVRAGGSLAGRRWSGSAKLEGEHAKRVVVLLVAVCAATVFAGR